MSRLPPDISQAITYASAQVSIDAPVRTVWEAILDFPSYPKWNTFVRSQVITDESFRPLTTQPKPTEGANILMHVRIPPRGLHDDDKGLTPNKCVITYIDHGKCRVVWEVAGYSRWFLRTERWQEVTEEKIDGRTVSTYRTVETFNGLAAWLIRWFFRRNLVISAEVMAEGLKTYSEALVGGT